MTYRAVIRLPSFCHPAFIRFCFSSVLSRLLSLSVVFVFSFFCPYLSCGLSLSSCLSVRRDIFAAVFFLSVSFLLFVRVLSCLCLRKEPCLSVPCLIFVWGNVPKCPPLKAFFVFQIKSNQIMLLLNLIRIKGNRNTTTCCGKGRSVFSPADEKAVFSFSDSFAS